MIGTPGGAGWARERRGRSGRTRLVVHLEEGQSGHLEGRERVVGVQGAAAGRTVLPSGAICDYKQYKV